MMKMLKVMMPTAVTIKLIMPIQKSGLNGHHQPGILSSLLFSWGGMQEQTQAGVQMLFYLFGSGELHSLNSMCLAVQLFWRNALPMHNRHMWHCMFQDTRQGTQPDQAAQWPPISPQQAPDSFIISCAT